MKSTLDTHGIGKVERQKPGNRLTVVGDFMVHWTHTLDSDGNSLIFPPAQIALAEGADAMARSI